MDEEQTSPFDMPDLEEVERGVEFDPQEPQPADQPGPERAEPEPTGTETPFGSPPISRLPLEREQTDDA